MLIDTIKFPFEIEPPKFQHDCTTCTHVANAQFLIDKQIIKADVYICNDTIILRWSDEGSDYSSMSISDGLYDLPDTSHLKQTYKQLILEGIIVVTHTFDFTPKSHTDTENPF